jgi:hypothetical protein
MISIRPSRQLLFAALFCCVFAGSALSQTKQPYIVRLCNRVAEIKQLPMKGDPGIDAAYDAIVAAGETIVPCLIDKIADTKLMRDPRCPPFSDQTTVGDVAYFVLTRITKLDFVELLPGNIQTKYKNVGAYAYHDYMAQKGARRQLQSKVRKWWRQKQTTIRDNPGDRDALLAHPNAIEPWVRFTWNKAHALRHRFANEEGAAMKHSPAFSFRGLKGLSLFAVACCDRRSCGVVTELRT